MSLDIFSSNIDDAVNDAARSSGAELPSTFSDNFHDAWNKGYLLNQSISGEIRKTTARSQMVDDAIAKTGDRSFDTSGDAGMFDIDAFNSKVAQHKALRPDLELQPMSAEGIQASADELGTRQLADSAHLAGRERTTGGAIGSFLGTAAAAVTDPVNLIAFPLAAPESLGVLGTALAWGGIGAGSQGVIEALNAPAMERVQPGYGTSGQPVQNILEAGLAGAVLGGGLKGLSALWTRQKTGAWPRTVRDAGNVVESEAQIAATNPLPGVEGEAAHRTALNKAIDDIANNRPVDVDHIITPDMLERSRGLIDRLQAEQPLSLPVVNQRAIELAADNQRLGARDAELAAKLDSLPAGDASAADRLNRLDAVEQQIEAATDPVALRKLNERRDQILVDTNPEALKAAAAPIEQRRLMESERAQIADQLQEITDEHARLQASMLSPMKLPELGQRERIPTGPRGQFEMDLKPSVSGYDPARIGEIQPDGILGFDNQQGKVRLRDGSERDVIQGGGLIQDENNVQIDPKLITAFQNSPKGPWVPTKPALKTPKHQVGNVQPIDEQLTPANIEKMRVDPDLGDTVSRDLDKLMLERPGLEVPMGVTQDADGRMVHTSRTVESVVNEADAKLAAAKEIAGCVGPYEQAAE